MTETSMLSLGGAGSTEDGDEPWDQPKSTTRSLQGPARLPWHFLGAEIGENSQSHFVPQ